MTQFDSQYVEAVNRDINKEIELERYIVNSTDPFQYSYNCHEGTLAFAYALNLTIAGKAVGCYNGKCIYITVKVCMVY